ncbi:MAG: Ig-like domain-containing protein, partial [Fusobacterium sp.]
MNKIIASLKNLFLIIIMISTVISCSKEKIDVKIPVTAIKLSSELEVLEIDGEIVLKANVLPENATNKNIIWSSQDDKIVTVDKNGKVHAVSAGTAVVTVKAEGSKISSTCKISVKAAYIPIEEIVFAETVKSIVMGETFTPDVKITPEDATDKTLVWSSSNEEIASVDDKGLVSTKKEGEVTITGTSTKDKINASYTLKVKYVFISILNIFFREREVTIVEGSTYTPELDIYPQNRNENIVWTS